VTHPGEEVFDADEMEPTLTLSLFEGDEGGLTLPQRRALVALVKHRFISARTHPQEWKVVSVNPRPLRSRLNDMFLDLVISPDHEVAYKRQVVPEAGGRFPTLLHDTAWGREDTVLLVFLRMRYRNERASGADRVFVDRADIREYVQQHRPAHATDVAGDLRRVDRAVEAVFRAGLLIGRSDGERFEISNAIEVLLPLQKLQQLLTWLRQQGHVVDDPMPSAPDQAHGHARAATCDEELDEPDLGFDLDGEPDLLDQPDLSGGLDVDDDRSEDER
jgi:Domain of unknown function (DUF4194)